MNQLELRDIHLPDAVSWWPPAIGWWIMLLVIIFTVLATLFIIKKMKQVSVQKIALTEFDKIKLSYQEHQNKILLSQQLTQLLRQVSLSSQQRDEVASATGEQWLELLNMIHPKGDFELKWLELLTISSYQKQADYDAEALIDHIERWISTYPKKHLL